MAQRDDRDPPPARMQEGGDPQQWAEQSSLEGPEFGQQVYGRHGGYSEQRPGSTEGSGERVSEDEALGAYKDQEPDAGEPVWGSPENEATHGSPPGEPPRGS